MKIYTQFCIGLALLGALAGCGGGGGGGGSKNEVALSGSVIKGRVANAAVAAWALSASGKKASPVLAQATTQQNGNFDLPKFSLYSSSVLIETTGGTYKDEATGNQLTNPGMKALIPRASGVMSVTVTPLTHLAFACISSTGLTRGNIDKANAVVSTAFGINIATTTPVDVTDATALSIGTTQQVQYGLMLAAVSKIGFAQFIAAVSADLSLSKAEQKFSQATADLINNAITDLFNSGKLDKNNTALIAAQKALAQTIKNNTDNVIIFDPATAKAFVADVRNTALAFYNYSSGPFNPNQLQAPYNKISSEIVNKIEPQITAIINSVGWVMNTKLPVGTTVTDKSGSSITITDSGTTIRTAVVKDSTGATIATLTFTGDSLTTPSTGTIVGNIVTDKGTSTLSAQVTAATYDSQKYLTGASIYGTFTTKDPSGNVVMTCVMGSQSKPVTATFYLPVGVSNPTPQLQTVAFNGKATTTTVDITVDSLTVPAVLTNSTLNAPLPSGPVTLVGTIKALDSTGMTLTGTLIGELTNAATIKKTTFTTPTSSDFPQWSGSFIGSLVAVGSGLDISATSITAKSTTYQQTDVSLQLQRTRPNGTKFNFNATGTYYDEHKTVALVITNQDGFTLTINTARDCSFSGNVTGGGKTLASVYMLLKVPFIKYSDDYVESLF